MRKRFSTTDIDRFFTTLKEQPPIYNEEKVNQIINSPAAKARLKGKNKNLLKFTIMTTLFAVIISAVLLWTGGDPKLQVSGSKFQVDPSVQGPEIIENDLTVAGSVELDSGDEMNAMADRNRETFEETDNNLVVFDNMQVDQKSIVAEPSVKAMPIDFDINTFDPVDGSKFVLKLSKEELEKIGFLVEDSLILYENNWNGMGYRFGRSRKREYGELSGALIQDNYTGYNISTNEIIFRKAEEIQTSKNGFSFYPVYKTDKFYSKIMSNGTLDNEFFKSSNDTLLPIVFPEFDNEENKVLLWFVVNNQLYDLLSANNKPVLDELLKIKSYKQKYPQKDFITYRSPFMLDESRTMKLSEKELEKLGFSFYTDSTVYIGRNSKFEQKIMLSKWRTSFQNELVQNPELNKGALVRFVTSKDGSPLFNLYPNRGEITKQIFLLIPVEVKVSGSDESVIFWILPNENFFNSISEEVSTDLQAEIEYITAEDKSQLTKPECKYFEECKNTLKVSSFKVYPNPANNTATISFTLPEAIDGRITLVDLSGRERQVLQPQTNYSKGSHRFDVDVSTVPEGIYLLTLYSDKGVQTQRLIVAR
jgi:hypothetical protein